MTPKIIRFAVHCTGLPQVYIEELYSNWLDEEKLPKILRIICEINDVNIEDVKGKSRNDELITARREYCYLACKLTQLSENNPYKNTTAKIGAKVNIDHATVLHHKRKVEGWLNVKGYRLNEKLELIEKQLKI